MESARRLAPEIIRLAPSLISARKVWADTWRCFRTAYGIGLTGICVVFLVCAHLAGGLRAAVAAGMVDAFAWPVLGILIIPPLLVLGLFFERRQHNRVVRNWRAAHPEEMSDARARALVEEQERTGRWDYTRLNRVLSQVTGKAERARIVLAQWDGELPAPVDTLIEPVVIHAVQLGPRRIATAVLVAGGLFTLLVPLVTRSARVGPLTWLTIGGVLGEL